MDPRGQVGLLLDAPAPGFDPDPVAVRDPQLGRGGGVDVHERLVAQEAELLDLEMLRVVVGHEAPTGGQDQRELLGHLGVVHLVLGGADVGGQGGIAQVLEHAGVELHLARGGGEALPLVLGVFPLREVEAVVLHELVVAGDAVAQRLDAVEVGVLHGLPGPLLGLSGGEPQVAPEVVVVAPLVHGGDGPLRGEQEVGAAVARGDGRALQRAGDGEHVIGERRGRRHPVLAGHHEVHRPERLQHQLGLAVGVDRVGGRDQERLDRVRLAGQDGAEH